MAEAIANEAKLRSGYFGNETIRTLYFGGGTPSLLSEKQLNLLFDAFHKHFDLTQVQEVTLEANPEDITKDNLVTWQQLGINRLSIGIQSFQPEILAWMNRVHDADMAENAVKQAQDAGVRNLTIDLMYGMPGLDLQLWLANIEKAIDLQVPHVSAYQLTIEPKTVFGRQFEKGLLTPVADHATEQQFDMLIAHLAGAGIEQYEVSNFAKPCFHSIHNSNYWEGVPYLGLGPSAHSFKNRQRDINPSSNAKYLQKISAGEWPGTTENLSPKDRANEMLLTGLRTVKGTSASAILTETGINIGQESTLKKLVEDGLMLQPAFEGQLRLTAKGLKLADRITLDLWLD